MSFPRYPKYKGSGVEWLGDVPEGWEVAPLKIVASHNDDTLDEKTEPDLEILYVDISGVDALEGIKTKEPMVYSAAPSRARRRVKHGDTIISTVRTYLRAITQVRNPEENLIVSTGFAVVRPRARLSPDYVGYVLSAGYFIEQVIARSTGVSYPAINASDLVRIPVAVPPLPEQTAIAEFLDQETAKIDGLVAEQRRLMALLKEKRQAVISHAVTKGLNPHAPMKPSGIEWLGDVPEHWETAPLKRYIAKVESGTSVNSSEEPADEGKLGVLKTSCVYRGYFEPGENKTVVITDENRVSCPLKAGSLIVSRMNTTELIGAAGLVTYAPANLFLPDRLWQISFCYIDSRFIYYWTQTRFYRAQAESQCTGTSSSMKNLGQAQFGSFNIAMPPKDEQMAISQFLENELAKFDALTAEAQCAIDLLQERRTALISAAVTGQIDVRQQTKN